MGARTLLAALALAFLVPGIAGATPVLEIPVDETQLRLVNGDKVRIDGTGSELVSIQVTTSAGGVFTSEGLNLSGVESPDMYGLVVIVDYNDDRTDSVRTIRIPAVISGTLDEVYVF